jgi:hypothetical protein
MTMISSHSISRRLAIAGLVAAVVYFIVMRHWEHFLAFAPYLIFLACPLMHLMGGHGRHEKAKQDGERNHDCH